MSRYDAIDRYTYPGTGVLIIALRRTRKVKLPDALIAATAIHHGLELLTLDQTLMSVAKPVAT
jgi:predicted nucleic acid-binding protein